MEELLQRMSREPEAEEVCASIVNMLDNIVLHPDEARHRELKKSSPVVAKLSGPAVSLLLLLGFEDRDDALECPLCVDLGEMTHVSNLLRVHDMVGSVAPEQDGPFAIEELEHRTDPFFENLNSETHPWVSGIDVQQPYDFTAAQDRYGSDASRDVIRRSASFSASLRGWLSPTAAVRRSVSFCESSTNWFSAARVSVSRRLSHAAEQVADFKDKTWQPRPHGVVGFVVPADFMVVGREGALIFDCPEMVRVVSMLPYKTVITGVEARAAPDCIKVRFQSEAVSGWVAVVEGAVHLVVYQASPRMPDRSQVSYDV